MYDDITASIIRDRTQSALVTAAAARQAREARRARRAQRRPARPAAARSRQSTPTSMRN